MIVRTVFVKLGDAASADASPAEVAAHTQSTLVALEHVQSVRVGLPADEASAAAWDLFIEVTFETLSDVEAYGADPVHRRFVDDYLKPRMQVLKAWNFELP